MENWDLIIIGAGAAGLAAGIYGSRSGLKTLIIEEKLARRNNADAPSSRITPAFLRYSAQSWQTKKYFTLKKQVHQFTN